MEVLDNIHRAFFFYLGATCVPFISVAQTSSLISDSAYPWLNSLVTYNQNHFFIFENRDSAFNHGFLSGLFGKTRHGSDLVDDPRNIRVDTRCVYSDTGCAHSGKLGPRNLLRLTFLPMSKGEFAGLNVEEPQFYSQLGASQVGAGYDLFGIQRLKGSLTSVPGGYGITFLGNPTYFKEGGQVVQSGYWYDFILLFARTPPPYAHLLFGVSADGDTPPGYGTFLFDRVELDPVPLSQRNRVGFPLGYKTMAVEPVDGPLGGPVAVPPDQSQRNVAPISDSALCLLVFLLLRVPDQDVPSARLLADSFAYALQHDNDGRSLPKAQDGSRGLHSGYMGGDLALVSDQTRGKGRAGQVRLPGFSVDTPGMCGDTNFCLIRDGASGGENAMAILALVNAARVFQGPGGTYMTAAREIGRWIVGNLMDSSGAGFGGYFLGYPDGGQWENGPQLVKSVVDNSKIYAAFSALADALSINDADESAQWASWARSAGDFVIRMYDPVNGTFDAGVVPMDASFQDGVWPNGPQMNTEVVNTFRFIEAQTIPFLALSESPQYRAAIDDWSRPIRWVLTTEQIATSRDIQFRGFNLVEKASQGPPGIAWEYTAQTILALKRLSLTLGGSAFDDLAKLYLDQVRRAQLWDSFADGQGIVAATVEGGDQRDPYVQCLSVPFQCIPQRLAIAATTWSILAEKELNPFALAPR